MKKLSYSLFIIAFLIFLITMAVFVLNNRILEEETFYTSVEVDSSAGIGFDVTVGVLTFGRISIPGSSTRNVIFDNGYDFPVRVEISVEGSIEPILDFDRIVNVNVGEQMKIPFTVYTYEGVDDGFYNGNVKLIVKPAW